MEIYKSAIESNTISENNKNSLDPNFWETYETRIMHLHGRDEQSKQLILNLKDTASRLFKEDTSKTSTACCWWKENTIFFCPKLVNLEKMDEEQRQCFYLMYDFSINQIEPINIYINLEEMTLSYLMYLTFRKSKKSTILDGVRLWSCIPYKIKKIDIIKPKHSIAWNLLFPQIKKWLSPKLLERMIVR
jgi:hypothetical protein